MIASSAKSSGLHPPQAHRQNADREAQLLPSAEAHAAAEYVVIAPLDLVQEAAVGSGHHQEDGAARGGQERHELPTRVVESMGPLHLETHQGAEGVVAL